MRGSERFRLRRTPSVLIWIVGAFSVAVWLAVTIANLPWPPLVARGAVPSLSDLYAGLGVLVSIFGFGLVGLTVASQQREADTKRAEDHFFQLLGIWHEASLSVEYGGDKARKAFLGIELTFIERFLGWTGRGGLASKDDLHSEAQIVEEFRLFYELEIGAPLAHILRMMQQLVLLVEQSPLTTEAKKGLVRVFGSILSDPELHLLLYYGLSDYANELRPLIDKYELLFPLCLKPEDLIPPEISYYKATYERCRALGKLKTLPPAHVEPGPLGTARDAGLSDNRPVAVPR